MNIKQLALVLGASAALIGGGMGGVACSSSSGNNGSSGSSSGGSSGGSSGSSSGSSSGGMDASDDTSGSSSGSSSGGSSSGCKTDPGLHPGTAGSIFCGYTDAGSFSCPTGQQCCLGGKEGSGYAPEQCMMWGGTCTNGTMPSPIECEQPQDCAANGMTGAACCLQGGASPPAPVPGCDMGDLISHGGSAIACEAPGSSSGGDAGSGDGGATDGGASSGACAAGELQICEAQTDCPTGTTCKPIRWKLYQVGVCL